MESYGVCFCGSWKVSPQVDLLGLDGGSEIGSTIGISDGNRDEELEGYTLGEWKFDPEARKDVRDSGGI